MSYITAITDRTAADIAALNSKAYINIADWSRIYGNSRLTSLLAAILRDEVILFDVVTMPAVSDNPQTAGGKLNTILANIERLRLAVADEAIAGALVEIKDDWELGPDKESPKYTHANIWESTVDAIWEFYGGPALEVCPTLSADLTLIADYIVVDCIDTNGHTLDTNGHTLYII